MFAVICDKCGKIMKGPINLSSFYEIDFYATESQELNKQIHIHAHICPECGRKMIEEMERLNKKEDDGSEQTDHHRQPHA